MGAGPEKVFILTREFPPDVYGGAGVHVEYLARELSRMVPVEVRRFAGRDPTVTGPVPVIGAASSEPGGAAEPRPATLTVRSYGPWEQLAGHEPSLGALRAISVDLAMAAGMEEASLAHSHPWVGSQDVPLHLAGHRDDRVRRFDRRPLAEAGHGIAAGPQLLGLPRTERLQMRIQWWRVGR